MAKERVFQFADWRGGEFGDLGAQGGPPNSFTGKNVMRYRSGAVGPRPGVKNVSPSGLPNGPVWALGAVPLANGIVFGIGNTLYGVTSPGSGAAVALGTIAVTPTTPQQIVPRSGVLDLAVYGDKAYTIDPVAATTTALTGSPAGSTLALYGVRMVNANPAANPSRVFYSAAADFNSWPALNFFDVGAAGWPVTYVDEIRQRLAIANGAVEWWALTGVPGVNDVLRRQTRGDLAALSHRHVARIGETLWFIAPNEDFPVQYSGVTVDKLRYRHLTFTSGVASSFGAASLPAPESVLFVEAGGTNRGLLFWNDVWTFHTFGVTTSQFVTAERPATSLADSTSVPMLLSDGGGPGVAAKLYAFHQTLDRPGKVGDTWAQPGDDSTTPMAAELATREEWGTRGEDLVARTVIVDFVKWNTGSTSTNHFDLVVRGLHRYNTVGFKDSAVQKFDEAAALTTADATVDRRVFRVGDQGVAQGLQVRFSNLRGVAIRQVTVLADSEVRG